MREREVVRFKVQVPDTLGWVTPDGVLGPAEAAAEFAFHAIPTVNERMAIDEIFRDLAGGRDKAARLYGEQANTRRAIQERVRAALVEQGAGDVDKGVQDVLEAGTERLLAVSIALAADSLYREEVWLFEDLNEQIRSMNAMAQWRVLQVAVPPGWDDLGKLAIPDEILWPTLWTFLRALGGARIAPGKGLSSPS